MWKICLILALWTSTFNAQHNVHMTNSRDDGGGILLVTSDANNETMHNSDDYKTNLNSPQLIDRKYNKNSRDSFATTNDFIKETNIIPNSPRWGIPTGDSFNAKLFEIMSLKAQRENLVYSPFSLETFLAFIFTMSGGQLYDELLQLLGVPDNRTYVAENFESIIKSATVNTPPTTVIMANKVYYDYRFGPIDPSVRNFSQKSFASDLEQIDFLANKKAANVINSWVSERTHKLIQDIVTPSTISADTSALLLNTLYFKSEWLIKFGTYDTEIQDFYLARQVKVPVDMMVNEDVFRYADFPDDLQASVVELPYETSNLSMLLILPKDIEGLADLERKLKHHDFGSIAAKLKRELATVSLPKFKVEFEIDMIESLRELGLNALFNNAGSINLFKNQQKPLSIDQFKHKCSINVNEVGTEAAVVTAGKLVPLSIPVNMKYFTADHPFVFVIRDSNTTYFVGHVVKF